VLNHADKVVKFVQLRFRIFTKEPLSLDSSIHPFSHDEMERQYLQSQEDLAYARSIQSMMAPTQEQLHDMFPDCMVYDRPMGQLSGDFLFVAERERLTYLAVCDCTGHGMSAALMTVLAREKLWQAIHKSVGPAHLLTRLDEKFRAAMLQGDTNGMRAVGMGLDLAVLAYNKELNQLRFAGAKRPLWIVRQGKLLEFKGTSRSIGGAYWRHAPFVETTLQARPGDVIFMFSDGVPDQFGGARDQKLKPKGLRTLALTLAELPSQDQREFLALWMENWQGDRPSTDDQLFVSFAIPNLEG
jgi:serine phosphatase RsbU (regulator of sigma subunit)